MLLNFCFSIDEISRDYFRELHKEMKIGFDPKDLEIIPTLNKEQRSGFDMILSHVLSGKGKVFFCGWS